MGPRSDRVGHGPSARHDQRVFKVGQPDRLKLKRLVCRRLAVTLAVTIPRARAVRDVATADEAGTFDTLLSDTVNHTTVVVIVARRPYALTFSADIASRTLVVEQTHGRRRNVHATTVEAHVILVRTIRVIFTLGDDLDTLSQLASKILFAVSVHDTLGWRW